MIFLQKRLKYVAEKGNGVLSEGYEREAGVAVARLARADRASRETAASVQPERRASREAAAPAQPVIRAPHIARAPAPIVCRAPRLRRYIMLVSLSATLSVPASEMLFTNTTFWMPRSRTKAGMFSLE